MKILQIIPNLSAGGAERFVVDLCNELSQNNQVVLCTLYCSDETMFFKKLLDDRVTLIELNKKVGLDLKVLFSIFKMLHNEKPDVINTHLRALLYVSIPAILLKLKVFHTMHNIAEKETTRYLWWYYKILFNVFKFIPIAISDVVLQSVTKLYGNKHSICITNGIVQIKTTDQFKDVQRHISSLKKTETTKVILNIGRIAPQKNQKMLIEVFNELIDEGLDAVLIIIGFDETPDQRILNDLKKVGQNRVHFIGRKPNVADYYLNCDVFCLSSIYEGLPITLLESISLGVISVCTPVGGIPDVIQDMKTGILAKDCTSECYKEALHRFFNLDSEQRIEIKNAAQQLFKSKFTMSQTANAYINLYTTVRSQLE